MRPHTDRVPYNQAKPNRRAKTRKGEKTQPRPRKNHGRELPHTSPPSTPAYAPPPAETATACTTGAAKATGGGRASAAPTPGREIRKNRRRGQIRLMTNSRKSQSENWRRAGAGRLQQRSRITKSPRPTPLTGREHVGGGTRSKSPEAEIDGKETVTNCSMLYTEGLRGDSWDRNEDEEVRGSQLPALDTKAAAVFTSINALPRPCRPAICRPHADSAGSGSWTS